MLEKARSLEQIISMSSKDDVKQEMINNIRSNIINYHFPNYQKYCTNISMALLNNANPEILENLKNSANECIEKWNEYRPFATSELSTLEKISENNLATNGTLKVQTTYS